MAQDFVTPTIDYTSRDFAGIRDSLISVIPYFTPEWTDHNPSDFGIVLLELFAYVADVLHFYIDRSANESFLPTATSRRSVAALLKLIDYEMSGPVPATADITVTLGSVLATDFTLPADTLLFTGGDLIVYFETVEDLVITAGNLQGSVGVREGQTVNDDYTVLESRTFLTFSLTRSNVYSESIEVYVDEGAGEERWIEVESFLESGADDKHFVIVEGLDGTLDVRFGDGAQGKIPAAASLVRIQYRIGAGSQGNVGANTINSFSGPVLHEGGTIVVTATNPLAASGGNDGESINDAKILGPAALRALYRAVTAEDYENLVLAEFEEVKKARAVVHDSHNIESGCCTIRLYIYPAGGGEPSSVLREEIHDYLADRKVACTVVEIEGPCVEQAKIEGTIRVLDGYDVETVQDDVMAAIEAAFDEDSSYIGFGSPFHLSWLYAALDGVTGVDSADIDTFTLLPEPELNPWRGDGVFSDIDVYPATAADSWEVVFTSATDFVVRGSNAGVVGTGQLGIEFTASIRFTITGTGQQVGDRAVFRTTAKADVVTPSEGCLLSLGTVNLDFEQGPEVVATLRRCVD